MPKVMNKCPYCGCEEYYTKQYASGPINYQFRFDGEEAENGAMYETLSFKPKSKYAFCCQCEKRLFKLDEKPEYVPEEGEEQS